MACSRLHRLMTLLAPLLLALYVSAKEFCGAGTTDPVTTKSSPLSILLVTAPFGGHLLRFLALGEELVKRGHNVTLASAPTDFIRKEIGKYGISFLSIGEGFISPENHSLLYKDVAGEDNARTVAYRTTSVSIDFQRRVHKALDNETISSFDVVVGDNDYFFMLLCFSREWNKPAIFLSASLIHNAFSLHAWPYPTTSIGYTHNLNFFQRLLLFVKTNFSGMLWRIISFFLSYHYKICSKHNIPLYEIVHFADYHPLIVTASFGFEFPRPMLPFTHYVGPLIPQYQSQLPQDIVDWLDERGPRSVVYVSMGTTAILTSAQAEMIINGATQANFSVVWSLRKTNQHILEHMTYDHDKVMIESWIPQVKILGHPSIHSAVLHGGLGGIQEALTNGVPILVIPFLFDQLDNAVRVQYYSYGEMIHLHEISASLVSHKLRIIGSDQYRKSVKKIQKIFKKDGGVSKAADLVELYSDVGYDHLVPSYVKYDWSWVQFYNVDVYFTLLACALLTSYCLYQFCSKYLMCLNYKKKIE